MTYACSSTVTSERPRARSSFPSSGRQVIWPRGAGDCILAMGGLGGDLYVLQKAAQELTTSGNNLLIVYVLRRGRPREAPRWPPPPGWWCVHRNGTRRRPARSRRAKSASKSPPRPRGWRPSRTEVGVHPVGYAVLRGEVAQEFPEGETVGVRLSRATIVTASSLEFAGGATIPTSRARCSAVFSGMQEIPWPCSS